MMRKKTLVKVVFYVLSGWVLFVRQVPDANTLEYTATATVADTPSSTDIKDSATLPVKAVRTHYF